MKIFKLNDNTEIVCKSEKTRNGFRHLATLCINGNEQETAKCTYLNRTWESYEFQSVIQKLIEKSSFFSHEDKKKYLEWAEQSHSDNSDFKMIKSIAMLGNIFCKDKKESNYWKARMLKAGLENKGLEMPEDWDTLDETTKQARLDGVIQILGEEKK